MVYIEGELVRGVPTPTTHEILWKPRHTMMTRCQRQAGIWYDVADEYLTFAHNFKTIDDQAT